MNEATCPVCDGMVRGGVLCKQHRRELAEALHKLRLGVYELKKVALREIKLGGRQQGRVNAAFASTPLDLGAQDLLDEVSDVLGEVGATIPVYGMDTQHMIRALVSRVDRLASVPQCGENHRALTHITLKVTTRLTPPEEKIIFGRCANLMCSKPLYGVDGQENVTCEFCGRTWKVSDIRTVRRFTSMISAESATAQQIAVKLQSEGYKIKASTIRSWAFRGKLNTVESSNNQARYLLSDVYALVKLKTTQAECA